jgi:hypothetical protein
MRTNIRFCKDSCGVIKFSGLIENAGSDMKSYAAPAMNNRKYVNKIENFCHRYPQSHWDRGIGFCGLIETAGFESAVSLRPRDSNSRSHWDHGNRFRSLIETAGSELCKLLSRFSRRKRSHMQNGYRPWIRALGGLFDEKNRGSKISWHCPFKFFISSAKLHWCQICWNENTFFRYRYQYIR